MATIILILIIALYAYESWLLNRDLRKLRGRVADLERGCSDDCCKEEVK